MKLAKHDTDGGAIYTPSGNGVTHRLPKRNPAAQATTGRDKLISLEMRFRSQATPERVAELAAALGVTPAALEAIGVGWSTIDDLRTMKSSGAGWRESYPNGAYAFPERDGGGRLVGFSLRASDGRKGAPSSAATGAKRGLIVPAGLHDSRDVVLVVEGASDVAACNDMGLAAVGRPSNGAGAEQLVELLRNRPLLIIGENDPKVTGAWPGRDGAERVAAQLATSRREPVAWALPPSGTKDVRAWLSARVKAGLNVDDADACRAAGQELLGTLQGAATEAEPQKAPTVAEQLVRPALESYRFGRTNKDEAFAVPQDGPNVAIMLKGSANTLRAKLAREYRALTGRTPGASALADAITVLIGEALDAEAESVHLRLAADGDSVVIDLADPDGRAVVVKAGRWEVVDRSPVLFRRTALTGAMPMPERGGTLTELRELLNVSDDSWPLIVGWLVAALVPDIPHPVLMLSGLQGTGKSCAARALVTLFDPSAAPLRTEPRKMEDWQVAASGSWAVALDNLSGIAPWLADAICRAATGDGFVKRALFTDDGLAVLSFRRVVLLTSIDAGALRGDFGERLLLTDLEPIPEAVRRTEQEIDALFDERRSRLFGALLDALAAVLGQLPDVRAERLPRMADFGRVLAAADAAGVTDAALARFNGQQGRIAAEVVEADPFGAALLEFVRGRQQWHGTATELLAALLGDKVDKPPQGWPKPNGVKGQLKRLTPALTSQGVAVTFGRDGHARRRIITLESSVSGLSASSSGENAWGNAAKTADDPADDANSNTSGSCPHQTPAPHDSADEADDADDRLPTLPSFVPAADEWGEV